MSKWNVGGVIGKIENVTEDNFKAVGGFLETTTALNVSGQGDPSLLAVDKGQHLNSIFSKVAPSGNEVKAGFDGSAAHSIFVELGTRNEDKSVRMAERPGLQRALYDNFPQILKLLEVQK